MTKIREKQLQKRKQETLDAAMKMLMERGYANFNMDELAEEVGISKPTLYQYFNSKEELVAQTIIRMFEKLEERLDELSDKSPIERIEQFLRMMLKSRVDRRTMAAPGDVETMKLIFQRFPNMKEHMQSMRQKISDLVRMAQDQGEIDSTLPTWVVVNTLFSMQGILHNPFMKHEPPINEEERDEAIESIVRLFRRGVSNENPVKAQSLPQLP